MEDYSTVARVQEELAKVYLAQKNIEMAEILCNKSVETAKKIKMPLTGAFSYCTLANIKIESGKPGEALEILENQVDPVFKDLITIRGVAISKRLKGVAYHKYGNTQDAVNNIQEAIDLFKEAELNAEVAKSYYELSKVYKETHETETALTLILEAFNIARAHNISVLIKKIEDLIFEIDRNEWAKIINETSHKEVEFVEAKQAGNETLSLVGDIVRTEDNSRNPLMALLRIGRSIAAETDIDKLLEIIAEDEYLEITPKSARIRKKYLTELERVKAGKK